MSNKGIPIQERSADDVREAFKGQEKEVIDAFVKLHAFACEHHLGISRLAAKTEISQTSLSQSFNSDYEDKGGNLIEIAKRIDTFFWKLERNAVRDAQRKFMPTRVSTVLAKLFEKTRNTRRIQPIESPDQVGKSRAAEQYTADNNSGRTRYYEFMKSVETMNDFIHSMAESNGLARGLKLRDKKFALADIWDSCDLVILDEFHLVFKLSQKECCKILDYVRTDMFRNGKRGIALLITYDREVGWFMDGLNHMAKAYRYNIGQFLGRSRIDVVRVDPVEDITEDDVGLLMSRLYKPGKIVLRELTHLAQLENCGHLGLVEDVMGESWSRTKARGRDCTDEVVTRVIAETKITLDNRKDLDE